MTIRTLRILLGSSALALLAGCSGDSVLKPHAQLVPSGSSTAKNERTLAIELTGPSRTDGGLIFTIEGPNIVDVTPASGFDVVTSRTESKGRATITALVVGPLHSGVIAWLSVNGVNSGQPYDVTVTQVAARASEGFVQRSDPGAYTLVVRR
jgi:hypothetical protein